MQLFASVSIAAQCCAFELILNNRNWFYMTIGNRLFYFQTNPINTKYTRTCLAGSKKDFLCFHTVTICVCMYARELQPTPFELGT